MGSEDFGLMQKPEEVATSIVYSFGFLVEVYCYHKTPQKVKPSSHESGPYV